ncbi:hypothetical protein QZH41_016723, partial [Actinostola sp. cb2023]
IGATVIPHRSYYRKPHHYFLLFYTGSGRHAGTTANVYCVIHGKQKETNPIVLRDPERLLFQSGTMTSFLVTFNKSLDQITKLHLWHDISGPKPSWFLERVVVCHLNTGVTWHFEGNRWLDVSGGESIECTLEAVPRSQYLRRKALFDKTFSGSFKNRHIWLSPFLLKSRTTFSRVEKLATCLAITMTTVLVVTIVVNSTLEGDPFPSSAMKMGPINFQMSDIIWAILCSIIPFSLRLVLELLFTYSDGKSKLSPEENDVQGYMEECLRKANDITILEEPESNLSSESGDTKEVDNSREDKATQLSQVDGSKRMGRESALGSEWEYSTEQSLSKVSLREVGLEFSDDVGSVLMPSMECVHGNTDEKDAAKDGLNTSSPESNSLSVTSATKLQERLAGNQDAYKCKTEDAYFEDAKGSDNSEDVVANGNGKMGNGNGERSGDSLHNDDQSKNNNDDNNRNNNGDDNKTEDKSPRVHANGGLHNGECCRDYQTNTKGSEYEYTILVNGEIVKEPEKYCNNSETMDLPRAETQEELNLAFTNSLTSIDRIPKLWKMLPLPGSLIDPNCVNLRHEEKSFRLQHRFFYLAIIICVLMSLIATIVPIRYGFFWSLETTLSWLTTILLALIFQVFVVETFFMLSQSIYFAIYLQRPTEENDIINEQKNKVWCKEEDDVRYYVDDLDDKSSPVPRPPDEEQVKKAREKAGQDRQLEEVLAMLAFDVLFLLQLVIIGFGNRDVEGYPMRVVVENNYNIAQLNSITNTRQFWTWTKDQLITGLYYQGQFKEKDSRQTRDGYGTLLGVPILRQQRIKPNGNYDNTLGVTMETEFEFSVVFSGTCEPNEHSKRAHILKCNVAIPGSDDYDRRQLYPGWKDRPAVDVTNLSPWRYKTGSESNTDYTMHARIGSHEPGGYIASLGYNKTSALQILEELEKLKWIDRYTRVVFVEYAVYNGNNNMLSSVAIVVEFTAFGGAFARFNHFSFRLYRYFTTLQLAYLICEIIFVVFIAKLLYQVLCQIHEQRLDYFRSFWNWTDFILVLASLITIGLYGARAVQLQKGVSAIQANPEVFFGFYNIALYDNLVAYMSCIVVLIPIIQFFKFLKFNKNFMIFDRTLNIIAPDLVGFALMFLISLAAFAFWAFHMLRLELESYSTFPRSFNSILSMLLGKFSFRVFSPGSTQEYGPLFTYAFTVVNVFFIMTIILCIITLGFTTAKQDEVESKYEIVKFIIDRLKDILGLNPPYIPPKPVIKSDVPVDYRDLQLQLNTRYVLGSQMTRIARFANAVYSEGIIDDIELIERILGIHYGAESLNAIIRKRMEEQRTHGHIDVPHAQEILDDPGGYIEDLVHDEVSGITNGPLSSLSIETTKMASKNPVFVVLDVETTGLTEEDRVVQIAGLKVDKEGAKTTWMRYINPSMDSERQQEAFFIHKISPEFLQTKPTFKEIAQSFLEFLKDVEFIVAHNCLFDWSMLYNEFRSLQTSENNDKELDGSRSADEFSGKFKWFDLLRMVMLHIPHKPSYRLDSVKEYLRITPEALISELPDTDNGGDMWKQQPHDAMFDVLTTYEVLKRCMQAMSFHELVHTYPQALLDTSLFIDMQQLIDDKRTSTEHLVQFALRAKEYFTTARPKGAILKNLRKDFLLRMTEYHRADTRTDRRIVLIYEAAYLDPPCETQSVTSPTKEAPKKDMHADAKEGNADANKDNDDANEGKDGNKSQSLSKEVSTKDKDDDVRGLHFEENDDHENPKLVPYIRQYLTFLPSTVVTSVSTFLSRDLENSSICDRKFIGFHNFHQAFFAQTQGYQKTNMNSSGFPVEHEVDESSDDVTT